VPPLISATATAARPLNPAKPPPTLLQLSSGQVHALDPANSM
jgi:hypothetical protein